MSVSLVARKELLPGPTVAAKRGTHIRESVDVAFGDVAFQICENGVFKEKNVRLNSAGCEPHSRSDECFLFENPIFTLLKRHVRKRHVYRLPKIA